MECLTWIVLSTEFSCFVAGEINQVIEAMPGSVVPLAMFFSMNRYETFFLELARPVGCWNNFSLGGSFRIIDGGAFYTCSPMCLEICLHMFSEDSPFLNLTPFNSLNFSCQLFVTSNGFLILGKSENKKYSCCQFAFDVFIYCKKI